MPRHRFRHAAHTGALMAAVLLNAPGLHAQDAGERVIWRTLVGETALEVRAGTGVVRLGAAGDSAVSVTLRASDVRRFADSLTRRLAARRARDTTWTLQLEEPGVSAGVLSLSPGARAPNKSRQYRLLVADDPVRTVRQVLDARETAMLARKLREAAVAATPRRAPARRPAAKPNAKPPAAG